LDSAGHRTRANDEPEYDDESNEDDENRPQAATGDRRRNAGSRGRTRHVLREMLRRGGDVVKLLSRDDLAPQRPISAILDLERHHDAENSLFPLSGGCKRGA
jgi:hypothetical protein